MDNSSSFFRNDECRFFPCHEGVSEDEFNCLFCYCPLYCLGRECGGNFIYNEKGVKVCTDCTRPHKAENYSEIVQGARNVVTEVREKNLI